MSDKKSPEMESDRFSLPSQFLMEDDTEHYKIRTDKIYTYYRADELLAHVDFSDITVMKADIDKLGEEGVLKMIATDAQVIAHSNIDGGLKVGDVEKLNDEVITTFTQDMINQINNFLAAMKQFMTPPDQSPQLKGLTDDV